MALNDIQNEILKLKKDKDICILAHCYQTPDIVEIADFVGDSFALSVEASKVKNKTVIMCGVRFMAETVKILSPEKTVYLANSDAGCPMAEMMDKELIEQVKKQYPDYTVVAYINTTSELKTVCDVCVTSSSALKICNSLDSDKILFIPDRNLGSYIAKQMPNKEFKLLSGGCPTHARDNRKQPVHLVTALQKRLRVGKAVCPKVFHLLNGHSVIEERIFQTGAAPHSADDSIADAPPGIRFKRRPFARLIGIRRV